MVIGFVKKSVMDLFSNTCETIHLHLVYGSTLYGAN